MEDQEREKVREAETSDEDVEGHGSKIREHGSKVREFGPGVRDATVRAADDEPDVEGHKTR